MTQFLELCKIRIDSTAISFIVQFRNPYIIFYVGSETCKTDKAFDEEIRNPKTFRFSIYVPFFPAANRLLLHLTFG